MAYHLNPDSAQTSRTADGCHNSVSWACKCLKWMKRTSNHNQCLHFKNASLRHHPEFISPAARTNCPSLDTLIEVHTVGISKSWMSSILRWMSGGKRSRKFRLLACILENVNYYDAVIEADNSPTSFFCSCLFFRSDSHCIREVDVIRTWEA